MKVKYIDSNPEAVQYFKGSDPDKHLLLNGEYTVNRESVHSWHTRIYLDILPDIWFNSVHFVELTIRSKRMETNSEKLIAIKTQESDYEIEFNKFCNTILPSGLTIREETYFRINGAWLETSYSGDFKQRDHSNVISTSNMLLRDMWKNRGLEPVEDYSLMKELIMEYIHKYPYKNILYLYKTDFYSASTRIFQKALDELKKEGGIEITEEDNPRGQLLKQMMGCMGGQVRKS